MCSCLPVRWSAGTVTNLSIYFLTAAIPLKFDPNKPRSADSHDDDGRHCLLRINAKDRGAHAKLGFILLQCPQTIARALGRIKNTSTSQLLLCHPAETAAGSIPPPLQRVVLDCQTNDRYGFQGGSISTAHPVSP